MPDSDDMRLIADRLDSLNNTGGTYVTLGMGRVEVLVGVDPAGFLVCEEDFWRFERK